MMDDHNNRDGAGHLSRGRASEVISGRDSLRSHSPMATTRISPLRKDGVTVVSSFL